MYPILCKVKYETLHQAFRSKQLWIQVGFSILLNWLVAPFLMVSTPELMISENHAEPRIAWTGMGIPARRVWPSRRSDTCWTRALHCNGIFITLTPVIQLPY